MTMYLFNMPKNKKINIQQTDEHRKAMQWCIKNNVTVGVLPTKKGLKVEINENGDKKVSPKIYTQEEAQKKVIELYLYIYKKYWQV
jgi:hypothetical protein